MNIQDIPEECFECVAYVRSLTSTTAWTCILCSISEPHPDFGEKKIIVWPHYQLECGHHVHPSCYRRWCARTQKVGCPFCGPRSKENTPFYCSRCDSFSCFHSMGS